MNILIMTNTYKPLLGGLERSIESFTAEYRKRGHRVVIVVPEYPESQTEEDVVRIPAVANFSGTNFSLQLPIPGVLDEALGNFRPDIVHSQHPFLVGDTALRLASKYNVPLVFTHHTLYEENVHYMPGNEEALKRFVIELSTGYANLADTVFAPSESIMKLIQDRGVKTPVHVVPTGIYQKNFTRGAGKALRKKLQIPSDAWVMGYIGRLAPEKNLEFLTRAVARFMKQHPETYFLVGGTGPSEEVIIDIFTQEGLMDRLCLVGSLKGKDLADAYHALNVFVFASQSETQGLVLDEAMAASVPVVAVDAPGVREVVEDHVNGCLLAHESIDEFTTGLEWVKKLTPFKLSKVKKACRETSLRFSMDTSATRALEIYASLCIQGFARKPIEHSYWESKMRLMQAQWNIIKNLTKAAGAMFGLIEGSEAQLERFGSIR
jgi:glycosyltransferase involved in cell wall biosynthesis